MSLAENKAVAQRVVEEGFNGRKLQAFDDLVASDSVNHDPNNPQVTDLASFKAWVQAVWQGFPDFAVEITQLIAEEDRVVHVWVCRGTQTGEFMGMPASGRKIEVTGMSVNRLANGKIVETWWNSDMLLFLQQLGVIPALGPAPA